MWNKIAIDSQLQSEILTPSAVLNTKCHYIDFVNSTPPRTREVEFRSHLLNSNKRRSNAVVLLLINKNYLVF